MKSSHKKPTLKKRATFFVCNRNPPFPQIGRLFFLK